MIVSMLVLRISHSAVVGTWRERERQLRAAGVDVRLLSARAWDEGGRVVRLVPQPGEVVRGVATVGSHPALFLYDPRPLWRALGMRWDVLDLHEEPFALATAQVLALRALRALVDRRPAPPVVLYSAQNLRKRYPPPFRWFEAHALRVAAALSVCNVEAGEVCRDKGMRGLVEVVPLGVDLTVFSPPHRGAHAADRDEAVGEGVGKADTSIVVGYAGRLAPHKGVDVLLRAVAGDARLHLRLAGGGPQEAGLRRAATPLGDRVTFLGSLDEQGLVAFYRGLDVLAVPSLDTPGWVEQFGRVAVEAMACGTPVVASSSGALPDVVGGVGLLVPPGDAPALRAALLRVGTEAGLARQLRAAGLARAQECGWPEVARRYAAIYAAVRDGAPRTPDPVRSTTTATMPTTGAGPEATGHPTASAPRTPLPPLEVVVVAYGSPGLLERALVPLAGRYPLTVVDNSSLPAVREVCERVGARYLDPGSNGGFGSGVNHALADLADRPAHDVLLLNPDAVISVADVEALRRGLHEDSRAASAGPDQVDAAGTPARVRWPFPSPAGTWVEAVGLGRWRPVPPDRSFVIGSVLLLRGSALAQVGTFDERFFLYAEETDWALRATRLGWRHVVVPGSRALHLEGATSSDPLARETHFHASQERYLRKHHGDAGWQLARLGAVAGAAGRSLVLTGAARAGARRRLDLYLRGPVRAEHALAQEAPA